MKLGSRPRRANNEVLNISNPQIVNAGLDGKSRHVTLAGGIVERVRALLRAIIGLVTVVAVLAVVIYLILAATVMVVAKPFDWNAIVMRGAYPEGQVPSGAVMMVSSAPAGDDAFEKLMEGTRGIKAASVVVIVAGPAVKVANDTTGQIVVAGEGSGFYAPVDQRLLQREYLGICLQGGCESGATVLVKQDSIIGKLKGYLDGFTTVRAPQIPDEWRQPSYRNGTS